MAPFSLLPLTSPALLSPLPSLLLAPLLSTPSSPPPQRPTAGQWEPAAAARDGWSYRLGEERGSGSWGVTALVKSSQGLRCWGIASPFKGGTVTSMHPLHPLSSSTSPPLQPPLALLFRGSQGSRQPRVNKVIPGVGQRGTFFPPFFSLLTPTSSKLWASHFTLLNPTGTSILRVSPLVEGVAAHVKAKTTLR